MNATADASPWSIVGNRATLDAPQLRGWLNLARPGQGLHVESVELAGRRAAASAALLGVATQPAAAARDDPPLDPYVRGSDLIVSYRPSQPDGLSAQIDWCLRGAGGRDHVGVEAIISVQTSWLQSNPATTTATRLAAEEVLQLISLPASRYQPLAAGSGELALQAGQAEGLLLVRLPGGDLSYVEMIHPSDFCQAQVEQREGTAAIHFRIFPDALEKGVIRRGRLRGYFLPRTEDCRVAAELFQQFCAAPPPLTA